MRSELEVCVDSLAGVRAALRGGADRIELCSELGVGGLTPSPGLLRAAAETIAQWPVNIELSVMLRPRAGHFCYDPTERECMALDLHAARRHGATGVVFGITSRRGMLDVGGMQQLASLGHGLSLTCHRAIDEVPDRSQALDALAELGFDYVLTSGGAGCALDGADELARSVAQCAGTGLRIMVGGGVRPENIAELRQLTRADAFHTSASEPASDRGILATSAYAWPLRQTSPTIVAACREALA